MERDFLGRVGRETASGGGILWGEILAVVGFCEVGRVVWLAMVSVGGWRGLRFGVFWLVCYGAVLAGDAGGDASGGLD